MFSQKKPYSAVTVTVERLTSESYEEDDLSGIPDLVEVIKLQASGPTEAARAIRKKLKYGSVHRQLRALVLLDGLIQNAGTRFQRSFSDEMLLERLRVCATDNLSDPDVRKKCSVLFRSWAAEYKDTPGMERIARLYKELPRRKQVVTQAQSKVVRETENPFDDDEDDAEGEATAQTAQTAPGPSRAPPVTTQTVATGFIESFSSTPRDKKKEKEREKRDKKKKKKPFNLEAEKPQLKATIADASMASTALINKLQSINREVERISENADAIERFEQCKLLRRKILRYIYLVNAEEFLGSLLHANDELVTALMTFEQLDRSIDADSDSDDDLAEQAHRYRMIQEKTGGPGSATSTSTPDIGSLNLGDATSSANTASPASPPPRLGRPPAPPRPSPMSKPAIGGAFGTSKADGKRPAVPTQAMLAAAAARSQARTNDDDSDGGDSYLDNDDDDDPFADRNAVGTPKLEQGEHKW